MTGAFNLELNDIMLKSVVSHPANNKKGNHKIEKEKNYGAFLMINFHRF